MAYALKKMHVAIMAFLLTIAGQVHGQYDNSPVYGECEDSCCCQPECCGKIIISAGLLYWRAYEEGLDDCFAIEDYNEISSDGNIISRFRGRGEDPDFNWDAGFRVGLGYAFACAWDIGAYWTHFNSNSNHHRRNSHENRWKLDLDVVDILVGRSFDFDTCFTLRPFGGLRGARIDQKYRTTFVNRTDSYGISDSYLESGSLNFDTDFSSYGYSTSNFITPHAHTKQHFWGIGPLIGVEADWNIGCGFSLYGNAAVGILYGDFHIRSNEFDGFLGAANYCNVRRNLCACQGFVDAGLGVRWETCFCENIVWLQLGLEHHSYFNQNRFGGYGDLCLDGANFSAGIAF